jgi:hypothetical protein
MVIDPQKITSRQELEKALDEAYKAYAKIERPFREFTENEIKWTKDRPQHKIAYIQHVKYSDGSEDYEITYKYRYSKRLKTPAVTDELNYFLVKIEILKRLIHDEVTRCNEQKRLYKLNNGTKSWIPLRRKCSQR